MSITRAYALGILSFSCQLAFPNLSTVGENLWHLNRKIGDVVCDTKEKACNIESSMVDVLEKVCRIEISVIDELAKVCDTHDCSPIPISSGGTLTVPGVTYCLTQNLVGQSFVFGADEITLDLNGFEVDGTGNASAVTMVSRTGCELRNGTISSAIVNGVNLLNCELITIRDVDFTQTPTGINVAGVSLVIDVRNCNFSGHTSEAICYNTVNAGRIINCSFKANTGTRVIDLSLCEGIAVTDCLFSTNTGTVLQVIEMQNTTNSCVEGCKISNSTAISLFNLCKGILLSLCTACAVQSCTILGVIGGPSGLGTGIQINGGSENMIIDNIISGLGTVNGLGELTGILSQDSISGLIKGNCITMQPENQGVFGISVLSGTTPWIANAIRVPKEVQADIPATSPKVVYTFSTGTVVPNIFPVAPLHNLIAVD